MKDKSMNLTLSSKGEIFETIMALGWQIIQ